jgi:regulator of replication initiation timing
MSGYCQFLLRYPIIYLRYLSLYAHGYFFRQRRRAQNRAAQRAFRARKEDTIKESSARLEALQEELTRLQSANGNLSETVSRLRSENARLRQENAALRCRRADGIGDWNAVEDDEGNLREMAASARSSFDEHEGRLNRFGLGGSMLGTVQWRDTGESKGGGNEDKAVAETVIDAAAALTRAMF